MGTLAFGRTALWMLFVAAFGTWFYLGEISGLWAILWTVLAAFAAYLSQLLFTADVGTRRWGAIMQGLCVLFAAAALWHVLYPLRHWVA
jgi:hypothetical protein